MFACDAHVSAASGYAWDWHPVAGVCGVPGAMWTNRERQGEGFCWWPEAEQLAMETIALDAESSARA